MTLEILFNAAGGLALFMMAMAMMTEGLKVYAGSALKNILHKWTSDVKKAILSGAAITGFVQSSSAVTVATIGFVNAGILSLKQALGVIFGANVGTTITGWFVSIMGFGIKLESFFMPMLAIGVVAYYTSPSKRHQGLGKTLTGFGLFFLGLSILQSAFSGVADSFGTGILTTTNIGGALKFVLIGFALTVLTQSSSAAIALILTAASEGVIGINVAAAAVVGANVGTTSTAVLAALHATPNAKRVAAGHVIFNVVTAMVALALLPIVIWFVSATGHWIGIAEQPAAFLALFHTVFNVLGVLLLAPFVTKFANGLAGLFKTKEEAIAIPHYLDKTVMDTPVLAMAALRRELQRLYAFSCKLALACLSKDAVSEREIKAQSEAVYSLGKAIDIFTTHVRMESMDKEQSEELPFSLRASRYLEEAARLAPNLHRLSMSIDEVSHKPTRKTLNGFLLVVQKNIDTFLPSGEDYPLQRVFLDSLETFQDAYQETKARLLQVAVAKHLSIEEVERLLDDISHVRRLIEQLTKAYNIIYQKRTGAEDAEHHLETQSQEETQ